MSFIASLLLVASAQASTTPADAPLPSEIYTFSDWVVTCDNGNHCQAVTLAPENPPAEEGFAGSGTPARPGVDAWERFGVLRLERGPAADAPLVITVGDFEGTPARLVRFGDAMAATLTAGEDGAWRVQPADLTEFLQNLFSDMIVVKDAGDRTISEIAINGAPGVLAYMDERQGRRGTATALTTRGQRPTSAIPAPPALPVVRVAPTTSQRPLTIPAARLAEARRQFGCDQDTVGAVAQEQSFAALGNGRTLIMMGCGAGAYNVSSKPLIAWQEGRTIRIEPARFDVYREPMEGEPDPVGYDVTNAEFDAATMSIGEWAKGRGLGDCGVAATYAWDGEAFRLVERKEMSECRGTMELLTTWRAERR